MGWAMAVPTRALQPVEVTKSHAGSIASHGAKSIARPRPSVPSTDLKFSAVRD